MFENIIERKTRDLFDKLNIGEPFVYLTNIINNTNIEQKYVDYFIAEVYWWIYEEQLLRKQNHNFDLSHKSLKEFFVELDGLYFELARFDYQYLKMFVEQCVSVLTNFLIRPRTTLAWFIFKGEPTKPINEIMLKFNYFNDYAYLKDGFNKWLSMNRIEPNSDSILSISEFKKIIEQVDNEIIFSFCIDDFIGLLEPMFYYFFDDSINEQSIPIEALAIFFDDKCIYAISEKLVKEANENNINNIDKEFIKNYLFKILEDTENSTTNPGNSIEESRVEE